MLRRAVEIPLSQNEYPSLKDVRDGGMSALLGPNFDPAVALLITPSIEDFAICKMLDEQEAVKATDLLKRVARPMALAAPVLAAIGGLMGVGALVNHAISPDIAFAATDLGSLDQQALATATVTRTATITPTVEVLNQPCRISKFGIVGFEYIDSLRANRSGFIDPQDYVIGEMGTRFGEVIVRTQKTETRGNMVPKGDHSEVILSNLNVEATTKGKDGKPAAELHISFAEDKVRQIDNPSLQPEGVVVVQCGGVGVFWGGRYASESDMRAEAKYAKLINTVGARIDQIVEQIFGRGTKPGVTPPGDNPAQNLKDFKANLEDMIEHAKKVRENEAKKAVTITPTATATPTAAAAKATGTSTPTALAKETATSTATVTATATGAGKKESPAVASTSGFDPIQVTLDGLGIIALFGGGIALARRLRH